MRFGAVLTTFGLVPRPREGSAAGLPSAPDALLELLELLSEEFPLQRQCIMYRACSMTPDLEQLGTPPEPTLVAQPWSSLGKIAYEAIIEGIFKGVLPAGTQISIDGAARQLKMSNTPVREALSRLAAERLVLFSANRGYTVTPKISADEYHQLFEARRTVELASIKSAILAPASIHRVGALLQRLSSTEGGIEYEQYHGFNQADREFHLAFVSMSQNRFLRHAWEQLHFHLHVGRLYAGAGVIDLQEARTEHQAIFQALKEGNRKELLQRMGDHIKNAETRLRRLVKTTP